MCFDERAREQNVRWNDVKEFFGDWNVCGKVWDIFNICFFWFVIMGNVCKARLMVYDSFN